MLLTTMHPATMNEEWSSCNNTSYYGTSTTAVGVVLVIIIGGMCLVFGDGGCCQYLPPDKFLG